ncbi:MAG: RagB/SusD family nutrient uptake outer membrane protein, partial [Coprobacter sp.]|nr:RagB/SusD family nutrient uptake outer membrane protein [Coprobacter sp.]
GRRYGNAQPIMTSEILPGPWGAAGSLYMTNGIWGFEQKYSLPKIIGYFEYTDKTAGIGFLHMVNPVFTTDELVLCRAEASLLKDAPDIDRAMADINVLLNSMAGITKTSEEIVTYYKNLRFMPTTLKSDSERAIKKRLNPQGFTFADENVENMIQCVLHLRRVLTVHEGLRWNDIKRYGIEVTHTRDGLPDEVLTVDDRRRAIQLPQEVITAGLQPNPRNK